MARRKNIENMVIQEYPTFNCKIDGDKNIFCSCILDEDCKYWKKCKTEREKSIKKIMGKSKNKGKLPLW